MCEAEDEGRLRWRRRKCVSGGGSVCGSGEGTVSVTAIERENVCVYVSGTLLDVDLIGVGRKEVRGCCRWMEVGVATGEGWSAETRLCACHVQISKNCLNFSGKHLLLRTKS